LKPKKVVNGARIAAAPTTNTGAIMKSHDCCIGLPPAREAKEIG